MRSIINRLPALLLVFLALVATAAMASGIMTTTPQVSAVGHTRTWISPRQPISATTTYLSAQALTAGVAVAGKTYSTFAADLVPGLVGRNVILTVNDNATDNLVTTWRVDCLDQFQTAVSETLGPHSAGDATLTGTKICQKITGITLVAITGLEASDTLSAGAGNVLAFPFMFSDDLHEFDGLQRTIAAAGTITALTINSTNIDSTNFACKVGCFGGSAIATGDTIEVMLRTDNYTPDNRNYPSR